MILDNLGTIIETRQVVPDIDRFPRQQCANALRDRQREIYVTALSGDFARFPANCPCKFPRGARIFLQNVDRITSISSLTLLQPFLRVRIVLHRGLVICLGKIALVGGNGLNRITLMKRLRWLSAKRK